MSGELRFSLAERKAGSIPTTGTSGNQVSVSNNEEFLDAVKSVHTSGFAMNWYLVGYDGSADRIKLQSTGTHGINELVQHLDDSQMQYAILRVVDIVDNIPTDRYLYITWVGDNVKGIDKARFGTNKSVVTKLMGHYNVEITASSKSELSEEEINNKVSDASGSRNRTSESVSRPTTSTSKPTSSVKPFSSNTTSLPTSNTKSVTGLSYSDESNIKSAIEDVKNPKSPVKWLLIGYENSSTLALKASGTGGLQELVSNLKASDVNYGLIKVEDQIDQSIMVKIAYINWVGSTVSPMVKGKIVSHKGNVEAFFSPYHVSLFGESPTDLSDKVLSEKIQALKGTKTN